MTAKPTDRQLHFHLHLNRRELSEKPHQFDRDEIELLKEEVRRSESSGNHASEQLDISWCTNYYCDVHRRFYLSEDLNILELDPAEFVILTVCDRFGYSDEAAMEDEYRMEVVEFTKGCYCNALRPDDPRACHFCVGGAPALTDLKPDR